MPCPDRDKLRSFAPTNASFVHVGQKSASERKEAKLGYLQLKRTLSDFFLSPYFSGWELWTGKFLLGKISAAVSGSKDAKTSRDLLEFSSQR